MSVPDKWSRRHIASGAYFLEKAKIQQIDRETSSYNFHTSSTFVPDDYHSEI